MKPTIAEQDKIITEGTGQTPPVQWALAGLCLSMLMPSLDASIANAGLPTLAHAFAASFQAVQWIVIAYLLAITTLIVSVGRLSDIVGRRRLLLSGIGLFTLASLLCGAAPTLWLLIAARAAQGLGAAVMLALTIALVGEVGDGNVLRLGVRLQERRYRRDLDHPLDVANHVQLPIRHVARMIAQRTDAGMR